MNLIEKIQSLLKTTTSNEVKSVCEQFLNTANGKEIAADDKIAESLFENLKGYVEKDSLVANLLLEQKSSHNSILSIEAAISKRSAKNLTDNWNSVRKDKKVSNVGNHTDKTLEMVNTGKANAGKALLEKLNVLGEKDPSATEIITGIKTLSFGLAESIAEIRNTKMAEQPQLKYILMRFQNALDNNVAESKLVKEYIMSLYPFRWETAVGASYDKLSKTISERAAELEVQNAIGDIQATDSKRFFDQLVTKMNEWLMTPNKNVHTLIKEMRGYHFNPIVKTLTNNLLLMENNTGKFNVAVNSSNCTIGKIFSPVLLGSAGDVFKAGNQFYISNDSGLSKLTEAQVNALPKRYLDLCEAFFSHGVTVVDDEVTMYVGKNKVTIGTGGTKINEKQVESAQLGQTLSYYSQGSIFRSDKSLVNVAVSLQENIDQICEIDYGKSIFSNIYEGTGVYMFKKSSKIYINKVNPSMNENAFVEVNGIQAVTLVKDFLNYNVAESLVEFLEGDLKKKALMEKKLDTIYKNIQLIEGEINKVDKVVSETPEIGEMSEIIQTKDLLDRELNSLKSKWNSLNSEIKKFEAAVIVSDEEEKEEKGEPKPEEVAPAEETPAEVAPTDEVPPAAEETPVPADVTPAEETPSVPGEIPVPETPAVTATVVDTGLAGAGGEQTQTTNIPGNDHPDSNATAAAQPAADAVVNTGLVGAGGDQPQTTSIPGGADVTQVQPTTTNAEITIPANIQTAATAPDATQIQPLAPDAGVVAAPEIPTAEVPKEAPAAPEAPAEGEPKDEVTAKDEAPIDAAIDKDKDVKEGVVAEKKTDDVAVREDIGVESKVKMKGSDKIGVVTAMTAEHTFSVLWDGGESGDYAPDMLEEIDVKSAAADNKKKGEAETKKITEDDHTEVTGEGTDKAEKNDIPEEYIKAIVSIDFGPFKANDEIEISASDYTKGGDDDAVKLKDPKGEVTTVPKKYVKISEVKPAAEVAEK